MIHGPRCGKKIISFVIMLTCYDMCFSLYIFPSELSPAMENKKFLELQASFP